MEEKQMKRLSLSALLLVTGFCFLSFTLLLKIADGVSSKFFFWIGVISLSSGLVTEFLAVKGQSDKTDRGNLAP